jgi:hypothetical protein
MILLRRIILSLGIRHMLRTLFVLLFLLVPMISESQTPLTQSQSFAAGSLVIPMDTDYQDLGMLHAYGLVYALLHQGVPVEWTIRLGKTQGDADFTVTGAIDRETGTTLGPHGYRGGPFVIDAAHRTQALPVIDQWLASDTVTVVHDVTSSFTAEIRLLLRTPPRIAVFADGGQSVALGYLNSAGIPDSTGGVWSLSSPDVKSLTDLKGQTTGGAPDGVLLGPNGTPAYDQLLSMRYSAPADEELIREVSAWLATGSRVHALMGDASITTFENAVAGGLLTTNGVVSATLPSSLQWNQADSPYAQFDGSFSAATGSVQSISLGSSSDWRAPGSVMVNAAGQPVTTRAVWVTGHIDADPTKGVVSYLSGREYSTTVPISVNTKTNGVRFFLNSLFASIGLPPSASAVPDFNGDGKPDLVWRNATTGRTTIWYMDGATWNGGYADVLPELTGSEWVIVGVADFNNDTHPDLLWRNTASGRTTIWYMNGATWNGGYADVEPTLSDPNWSIVSIADFNRDGSQDLLWRNSSTGRTTIWYMTGPTWNGGYADVEPTLADPNWSILGIADFNRDGSQDLLWRNSSTGRTTIWYMTGPTWNGGYADVEPTVSDPDWQIVAIRDFNNDGSPDLLWRNSSNYRTTVWYMTGPTWNGNWGDLLPIVSDPSWIIIGR